MIDLDGGTKELLSFRDVERGTCTKCAGRDLGCSPRYLTHVHARSLIYL